MSAAKKDNGKRELMRLAATLEKSKVSFKPMKVFTLIRNGERCDRVFPEWIALNINDADQYNPTDLNMPAKLYERPDGPSGYIDDSPLTEIGVMTCKIIGRSLKVCSLWPFHRIYCSPAFRSVQSAMELVRALKSSVDVCVEPALFDFLGWYKTMPSLLSAADFQRLKFPIYAEYNSFMSVNELKPHLGSESIEKFYERINNAIDNILKKSSKTEHVIIVTHAPVVDASIKSLRACPPKHITQTEMFHMGTFYPYCSTVTLAKSKDEWSFVSDPVPPLTYLGISNRVDSYFIVKTTTITGKENQSTK